MLFDIYNIDEAVYPPEERSTMKQIMDRFISTKNDYWPACYANKLIGYMSYFPINNRCRDKLINNDDFMDGCIDGTHILENKLQGSSVYIISVAVLPEYQGLGLGMTLIKELDKRFDYLNNIYGCEEFIATAVTDNGARILTNSGFKELKTKSNNYCVMCKQGGFNVDEI